MIVEFLEGRDFMCAWVLSPASRRLGVLAQNGREMNISQNRIINSSQFPDPETKQARLELLRATASVRRDMASSVNLAELWDVLEGEGDNFPFKIMASLYYGGEAGPDETSAIARAVFADGLRFRFTPEGAVRQSREELEQAAEARQKAEETERVLTSVAAWVEAAVKGLPAEEPSEALEAKEAILDLALWGDKAARRTEARTILERAHLAADEAGAIKVMRALGEFSRHENLELRRLDIPLEFSSEAVEAAAKLAAAPIGRDFESRLDLTSLPTMTIDSNGAKDLDDAISIKSLAGGRFQVGIHITDVAAFITPGSILDEEAKNRGTAIYLPEAKYPMLPSSLSEGLFSLTLGDVKPAFSFLATLEKDGRVSEYSLAPSLIRVDRQLSFAEADQMMDDDSDLVDLWDLAQALIHRREADGGHNLNIPKLNVYFMPDGNLNVGTSQWGTPAKTIVGELMILANFLAADMLHKNGYPCPYRCQDKSRPKGADEETPAEGAAESDLELARNLAARRRTGHSKMALLPSPHYGLGLAVYTYFTAPMRRYVDLLVARQLRSLVTGGPAAINEQEFMRLAIPSYELQQRVQKMQGFRQRYWLMNYLADKVGKDFSALVFEQHDRRIRVCVTDFMLETDLFLPRNAPRASSMFGARLTLKLAAAEPGAAMPRFEII